jgi:hypothetical protein
MTGPAAVAVLGGVGLVIAFLATAFAYAARSAWRRAADQFQQPPLAALTSEALAAQGHLRDRPDRWPPPKDLAVDIRAAYGRLARDRADNRLIVGELMLLLASAFLGATIIGALTSESAPWVPLTAVALGGLGAILRTVVVERWREVAALYDPPVAPPDRVVRRRRRVAGERRR